MRIKQHFFILMGAMALVSCNKQVEDGNIFQPRGGEIVFGTKGIEIDTKAVTATTLGGIRTNGFKAAVIVDSNKSVMFNKALGYSSAEDVFTVPGEVYYYPAAGTISAYAVYPKSENISLAAGVATVAYSQNATEDLVVAQSLNVSKQSSPIGVVFDHVLSQVSFKAKGMDTGVNYKLKIIEVTAPDGGTYRYASNDWGNLGTATAYSAYTNAGASVSTASYQAYGESMTFVPGEVILRIVWDCYNKVDGSLIASYDQSVTTSFVQGNNSIIKLLLPNSEADEIKFTIELNDWIDDELDIEIDSSVYDLSKHDIYGNSTSAHNTANCYVVKGSGTYRLPLVYGNGIKDDEENTAAFTNIGGSNMADFADAFGDNITSAFIEKHWCTTMGHEDIDGVKIVWMDQPNLVSNLEITEPESAGDLGCSYLNFKVNGNKGNAVIAVTAAGDVVWSWHIWVYNGKLEIVEYESESLGDTFSFLNVPLGWTKFGPTAKDGAALYYQYGRKDPMPFGKYDSPQQENTLYGSISKIVVNDGPASSMNESIQLPETFFAPSSSYHYNWFEGDYNLNLWNASQDGYDDDFDSMNELFDNQKTIYDPCPVGFCVPQIYNFKAMIQDYYDNEDVDLSHVWWDGRGMQITSDFYIPAAGYRYYDDASLYYRGSLGNFWSSSAFSEYGAWYLDFSCDDFYGGDNGRSNGFAVLPVPEFN